MDTVSRNLSRNVKAMRLGLPRIESEIAHLEKIKKSPRSVKQRLERLYQARNSLVTSSVENQVNLVQQLKEINNG